MTGIGRSTLHEMWITNVLDENWQLAHKAVAALLYDGIRGELVKAGALKRETIVSRHN